ncbi:MAG: CHRD domain-containing protein [Lysobacter sp.]|nr:CHRD domain-containing protein [Lysobacter sp.]
MARRLLIGALLFCACASAGAATVRLHATLAARNVVSASDSPATGEARGTLDDDNHLRLTLVYGGATSTVTGVALHVGTPDSAGPVAVPLDVHRDGSGGSLSDARIDLTDSVAASMRAGSTYLEVDTVDHPLGEIRGQLTPQPASLADLPPATSSSPGTSAVTSTYTNATTAPPSTPASTTPPP